MKVKQYSVKIIIESFFYSFHSKSIVFLPILEEYHSQKVTNLDLKRLIKIFTSKEAREREGENVRVCT